MSSPTPQPLAPSTGKTATTETATTAPASPVEPPSSNSTAPTTTTTASTTPTSSNSNGSSNSHRSHSSHSSHSSSGGGSGPRLPSLDQLAERISSSAVVSSAAGTKQSAPRPRLAASLLRTGPTPADAGSTAAAASLSHATRSAGSSRSTSSSVATTPSAEHPPAGNVLSSGPEGVHSQPAVPMAPPPLVPHAPAEKLIKGYKNIPSLDAITARLAKARSLSVDGTAKPPDAEMIEDPKSPGLVMKAPEHPLQYSWTLYHDTKAKPPFTPASTSTDHHPAPPPESDDYEAGLTVIGDFDTVESFCRYFNWLKLPSKLERNSNYHLFKSGIKPMWEDEANARGGKWVLTMKNNPVLLDRCWSFLAMALVGQELEEGDEICGAVVSLRSKVDRIQVWTRSKEDVQRLNAIGKKLVKLLDVSEADNIGLEFQFNNTEDRPMPNKFLSISAVPITGFRSGFMPHGGPPHKPQVGVMGQGTHHETGVQLPSIHAFNNGGAFGNFGVASLPAGGAVPSWRPRRV